ncbi:MAG: F0F1 ATP synthase subunit gamma [Cyanobacteria bacterium REEB67]|nr:F0F1 ATP synthase subunit gamma [Cyanobacteria bacterium REEB67]
MTETIASLKHKLNSAADLQSVVRTMKAAAASNVGQYESAATALADYYHTVELGLHACFSDSKKTGTDQIPVQKNDKYKIRAFVFGSEQGLVGRFNEEIVDFAAANLKPLLGKVEIVAVGARVQMQLQNHNLKATTVYELPTSIQTIAAFVAKILLYDDASKTPETPKIGLDELHLFYNRPEAGKVYVPTNQKLLPLNDRWRSEILALTWPTKSLPEVIGHTDLTLKSLIREYLFVSIFRACALSLASENTSRLSAMERADKNIADLLETLHGKFQRLRQSTIDEELFDVIAGFEALNPH